MDGKDKRDGSLLEEVDDTIHAKARLGIMSLLVAEDGSSFVMLKRALGLTDGNLGAHIRILEEAGYLTVEKGFEGRKPLTVCHLTEKGRAAYLEYVETLERILHGWKSSEK